MFHACLHHCLEAGFAFEWPIQENGQHPPAPRQGWFVTYRHP